MKKAMISELKNNLSRYLSYVRRGGVVRVLDRGRPIAELVPVDSPARRGEGPLEAMLDDLESKGIVRRGGKRLPNDFLSRRLPRAKRSVTAALIEERESGR